jgi:LPXTG-motif cell wall-anchored protein
VALNKHIYSKTKTFVYTLLVVALLAPILSTLATQTVNAETQTQDYGYTKTFGGTGWDETVTPTVDDDGNVYITGDFEGTADFDPGAGFDNRTSNGSSDIFLTKINADGSYGWTKTFGGTGTEYSGYIALDNAGNIYLSNQFSSTVDFDSGVGVDNHTSNGSRDLSLTKLNTDGSYGWTKTMGGTGIEYSYDIFFDGQGSIYLTGNFNSTTMDFNPDAGIDTHTSAGNYDIYVIKFNADGSYGWAKTMGGTGADALYASTFDSQNNIFLTGSFSSTVDFDPGGGTDNHTSLGGRDIYVTKLNSDGSYGWTKTMGGTADDHGYSIAVDSQDNILFSGGYRNTVDFDTSVVNDIRTSNGAFDIFLSKLNSDGSYGWTKTMGGTGWDYTNIKSLALDSRGNIYLTGYFDSTALDFDPGVGTDNKTSDNSGDVFLTKFNSDGSYSSTQTYGGTGYDDNYSGGLAIDSLDNLYITGMFASTVDFNPYAGTDNHTSNGSDDIFLTKLTTTYTQHINSLATGLSAATVAGDSIDNESTDDGIVRGDTETVRLSTDTGIPLADVSTDFDSDLDWSGVTAASDSTNYKAFVHNLVSAPGTGSSYSLYVPYRSGDDRLIFCPGVTSLSAVTPSCTNRVIYQESDSNVSIVTINGSQYWKIDGVTGSGAMSTTASSLGSTATLADTGQSTPTLTTAGIALLVIGVIGVGLRKRYL